MRSSVLLCLSLGASPLVAAGAGPVDVTVLQQKLTAIPQGFDGRVGACVQTGAGMACVRGEERFPLQSVMKLVVAFAVLDAVDHRGWRLDGPVDVHRRDLSLYVQPLARLVGPSGFRTTIGDLVRRAVIDSDSAAVDILMGRLGGPIAVGAALQGRGIDGVRVDRDERHLQTEIVGLTWRPEYVDPAVLERAIAAVPGAQRERAYAAYRADPRDTATPRGMTEFLFALAQGKLLSGASTAFLLHAMRECVTFPDRLKAGAAPGWQVAHKTGTSGSWKGLTAATNDVGILTAPDGTMRAVSVFVADSRATSAERAAIISRVAAAATGN